MVCEEHCPVPEKAIRFIEVAMVDPAGQPITVRQPYVLMSCASAAASARPNARFPAEAPSMSPVPESIVIPTIP